jgi:antitoxin CptB
MDRVARQRLKWKCRRGLLELDLVLERMLAGLGEHELAALDALLELPDNDLWDVACGRSDSFDPHLTAIVARLRAA